MARLTRWGSRVMAGLALVAAPGCGGAPSAPPEAARDRMATPDDMCAARPADPDGAADGATCSAVADATAAADGDGDGIPDGRDACPLEAEDVDGFDDTDGCPDEDNDGDGLLDIDDKCPDEPEVFDGCDFVDGCPGSHCKPGVKEREGPR